MKKNVLSTYDEKSALYYYDFAKMAYKCPEICENIALRGRAIDGSVKLGYFSSTPNDAQYYTFVGDDKNLIFAFRGSSSLNDFMVDANIFKTNVPRFGSEVYVHKGFFSQFVEFEQEIKSRVSYYVKNTLFDSPIKVTCIGHSLGGALASLTSLAIKKMFGDRVHVTCSTFGSPRVGNHAFSVEFNDAVDKSYRYVNENDIVAFMPKLLYYHVKGEVRLGNPYEDSWVVKMFGSVKDHYLDSYKDSISFYVRSSKS